MRLSTVPEPQPDLSPSSHSNLTPLTQPRVFWRDSPAQPGDKVDAQDIWTRPLVKIWTAMWTPTTFSQRPTPVLRIPALLVKLLL